MLVGGVAVEDRLHPLAGGHGGLDAFQKADELPGGECRAMHSPFFIGGPVLCGRAPGFCDFSSTEFEAWVGQLIFPSMVPRLIGVGAGDTHRGN